MSTLALEKLVGKAVISDEFRAGVLNGRRAELIRGFDLEPDEVEAVLQIRASTLTDFAGAVYEIVSSREMPWETERGSSSVTMDLFGIPAGQSLYT